MQLDPTNVAAYIICGICVMSGERVGFFKTAVAFDPKDLVHSTTWASKSFITSTAAEMLRDRFRKL